MFHQRPVASTLFFTNLSDIPPGTQPEEMEQSGVSLVDGEVAPSAVVSMS